MEETQQQDIMSDPVGAVPYLQQMEKEGMSKELLTLELDIDSYIEKLKRKLSGFEFVFDETQKKKVWKQTGPAWINQKGISRIVGIIRGHVDVNTFLSFLQDDEINHITYSIANEITTILSNKCVDFDIDPTYLGAIHSMATNTIFMALKRAQGAMTLKQIHESTHRIESHNPQQQRMQESKGFMRRFW